MICDEDKIYLDKIDEIGDKVYDFYNMSDRRDLIMVYEMKENRVALGYLVGLSYEDPLCDIYDTL